MIVSRKLELRVRKFARVLCGVAVLVLLISCSTKELRVREYQIQPSNGSAAVAENSEFYLIGPGDVLDVVVWKVPSVSGQVRVRPDGFITVPLVNEVKTSGLTPAQLREILEKQYKDFIADPFVTIRVEQITSNEVFVIGEVNKPGAYPWRGKDTVLEVLTRAGGLSPFAERDNIRVVRRDSDKVTEYTVDYNAILKGDLHQDLALRAGDRVIVP